MQSNFSGTEAVVVQRTLRAPAERVWVLLRSGDRLDQWFPAVSACRLTGNGVGARRTCVVDGRTLEERLVTVDDAVMLFQYRIEKQDLLPVAHALGTLHVSADPTAASDRCSVLWLLNYELEEPRAAEAVQAGVRAMYLDGLDGLQALASQAARNTEGA